MNSETELMREAEVLLEVAERLQKMANKAQRKAARAIDRVEKERQQKNS